MRAVINYVEKEEKVLKDGIKMIAGKDCVPEIAYNEFMSTKNMYKKVNGTFFYHFVQSFDPKENIEPLEVQAIGLELAEYFKGYEVLVATHFDKEHKHNHLLVNSVSFEDGKKFQGGPDTIEKLRELSDKICSEHGFSILAPHEQNKAVKGIGTRESRIAMKGESWKFLLMNIIDDALEITHNKEEFIKYMENHGYQVNWTDSRKYITYTIPDGRKVRDIKLHNEKYLKERMEIYYGLGTIEKGKQTDGNTTETLSANGLCHATGAMGGNDGAGDKGRGWSDRTGKTDKAITDNTGNGRTAFEGVDKHFVSMADGEFAESVCDSDKHDKGAESGNSTDKRADSKRQNKHSKYDSSAQPQIGSKNNSVAECIIATAKNLLALENDNDFIQNTIDTKDLSHLKGDELSQAIKNLEVQHESIKAHNDRVEKDKKDAQNLDMALTLIEEAINNNEEDLEL